MRQKLLKGFAFLAILVLVVFASTKDARALNVDVYSNYYGSAPYIDYTSYTGSFTSSDIMFATDTGYSWHPFGLGDFAAEITGSVNVAADAIYGFSTSSDDGLILTIGGNNVIDNWTAHAPTIDSNAIFLTAGLHSLDLKFFECCGGPSGVDLTLPQGVSYASSVPEPSTLLLMGGGLAGLAFYRRKFFRKG